MTTFTLTRHHDLDPNEPLIDVPGCQCRALEFSELFQIVPRQNSKDELSLDPHEVKATKYGPLVWSGEKSALLFSQSEAEIEARYEICSDAWVFFALQGALAPLLMERLVALELRPQKIPPGHSFRARIGNYDCVIITSEEGFDIGVASSLAQSFILYLKAVAKALAAQNPVSVGTS